MKYPLEKPLLQIRFVKIARERVHGEPKAYFPRNGAFEDLVRDLTRIEHGTRGHEAHEGVPVDALDGRPSGIHDGLLRGVLLVLSEGETGLDGEGAQGEEVDGAAEGSHGKNLKETRRVFG